ncbi:MAG: DUF2959 family protein [Planctomycetes bacterium]|nr:DUF2959 family protein [Planctomycetota bacterium]
MSNPVLARLAAALVLLPAVTGCEAVSNLFVKQSDGTSLTSVDGLLDEVESVHVELALSRQRLAEAMSALRTLVAPDFGGDALSSYALLVDAVERSETQAAALRAQADPMQGAAEHVFAAWQADLSAFADDGLRQVSRERMEETHARYDAILTGLLPALARFDELNRTLRDAVLFLGHDFNATAVAELAQDVQAMDARAAEVDALFVESVDAARSYVQAAAMPGETSLARRRPDASAAASDDVGPRAAADESTAAEKLGAFPVSPAVSRSPSR